jgi:hypothetical protein
MHGCGFKMREAENWFYRAKTAAEKKLPLNERIFGIAKSLI